MTEEPKAALEVRGPECGIDEAVTERIRERAETFVSLCQRSVTEGWELGKELFQAKTKVKHGYWVPWIETQVRLTPRTAQRLMELYTRVPKKRHVTHFASASEALRLLPPAKSKRKDESASSGAGGQKGAQRSPAAARSDLTKAVARLEAILKEMAPSASPRKESDLELLVKLTVVGATTLVEHLRAPADGNERVVGLPKQALAKLKGTLETIAEHQEATQGKLV